MVTNNNQDDLDRPSRESSRLDGLLNGPSEVPGTYTSSTASPGRGLDPAEIQRAKEAIERAMNKAAWRLTLGSSSPYIPHVETGGRKPPHQIRPRSFIQPPMASIKIVEDPNCVELIYKSVRRRWGIWEWLKQHILMAFYHYDYTPIRFEVAERRPVMYQIGKGMSAVIICHPQLAEEVRQRFGRGEL